MTARLTIDQVRVGMKVVCVDDQKGTWGLRAGNEYVVSGVLSSCIIQVEGNRFAHRHDQFTPAPALPAMTAELLAALRTWYAYMAPPLWFIPDARGLMAAIERAGILAPPAPSPPGVTDVQATLQWEWLL